MMADASSSIFNKKATEKLRSPDDLDKYVRVTNPSVWIMLLACIALLIGLLSWGVFGAVETSISTTSVVTEMETDGKTAPTAICLLNSSEVSEVNKGDTATVGGVELTVAKVNTIPLSAEEAKDVLGSDFLASTLMKENWAYMVIFEGDISSLIQNAPLSTKITVERIAPISLILKNW